MDMRCSVGMDAAQGMATGTFLHMLGSCYRATLHVIDPQPCTLPSAAYDTHVIEQGGLAYTAVLEWHRLALWQAMEEHSEHLDEALLSNAYAWMRKASDDGLQGGASLPTSLHGQLQAHVSLHDLDLAHLPPPVSSLDAATYLAGTAACSAVEPHSGVAHSPAHWASCLTLPSCCCRRGGSHAEGAASVCGSGPAGQQPGRD